MKAYRISSGGSIAALQRTEEKAVANLAPHDVRVTIHAVALNYRDLMVSEGSYLSAGKEPVIPGSDGAGEVVEVGARVTRFRVGDRVTPIFFPDWVDGDPTPANSARTLGADSDGVLVEQIVASEESLVRIPDHLDYIEAATLPCAAVTAWNALFVQGALQPGQTVLLQGTGGVSIHALQLAQAAGANTIITSSSDTKLERARKLGADAAINYRNTPQWHEEALRLTGGRGVDLVLEIGGRETLKRSLLSTRMGGTVCVIGGLSGWSSELEYFTLISGARRITGIFVGSRKMLEDLYQFIGHARIRPAVDRAFGFDQAREAYEYLKSGNHFGKVVVRVK
jgi:NADPH:quinone reductase-like Zn-dependent oxidoreductase